MNWQVIKETWKLRKRAILVVISLAMIAGAVYVADMNDSAIKQVAVARLALSGVGTLVPVEDKDTNIIPMVEALVGNPDIGVTIDYSSNPQVTGNGTIIYGTKATTGVVKCRIHKGDASIGRKLTVTIPPSKAHLASVEAAKLAAMSQEEKLIIELKKATQDLILVPSAGTDHNIITMMQRKVNEKFDGVVVDIYSSSNTHVSLDGNIIYNAKAEKDLVTFQYRIQEETVLQDIPVSINARIVIPEELKVKENIL